jgi:enterochelin esterase family protein
VLAINQPVQRYLVYTPRCYRYDTAARYPTLYLLHGAQTDETQWEQVGVFSTADRLIAAGAIAPMIIVLPDGIWAMGTYAGSPTLFDRFLVGEVLPAVDQDYRTIAAPAQRALGGISRGGEWAILEGGRHPDLFGEIGGHSPAVGPPGSPSSLLVTLYQSPRTQRVWLDVGSSDSLVGPVTALHTAWDAAGVAHELHTSAGGHDRTYWASQTEAYLRFYAAPWTAPGTAATGAGR